jgi:type IV pilus assembly protein PilY1
VNADSQSAPNFVAYLRGDSTKEVGRGGVYRARTSRLGDIVNSRPIAVGAPSFPYYDVSNPGYSSFRSSHAGRKTVVYAGANDGMLHAFDGSAGADASGSELFTYIPSFVYGNVSTASTTGLASLGNPNYTHHYFVDSTPGQFDLNLNRTGGSTSAAPDWRTLLIGGLGKGGKGYYAIDVTDPGSWTSEAAVAGKVMWEFTHPHMGYSYGQPSVVKTKKYGWVVVLTSGYNNDDGVGYFFLVNPRTGKLLEAVATPTGSTSAPVNLAHETAFVPDYTDMTADAIYAGDLQGNVWRLDVTGTGSYSAPTLIAKLTNGKGDAQPVTTRPLIEFEPNSSVRHVTVGTGELLADSDINNSSQQSFYSIVDGTSASAGFYTTATLPGGVSFPITRGALNANPNLLTGIGSSPSSAMGWYFDLPVTGGTAQRADVNATANQGVVAFIGNLPTGGTCDPSGIGTLYATSFSTGKTVLVDGTQLMPSFTPNGAGKLTDVAILNVGGTLRLYTGGSKGVPVNAPANLSTPTGIQQLNWREVPVTD